MELKFFALLYKKEKTISKEKYAISAFFFLFREQFSLILYFA
jgi:hypothetical protein